VLATGLMVIAFLSLTCGMILDTVTRGRWEAKRMAYLAISGPQNLDGGRLGLSTNASNDRSPRDAQWAKSPRE
jgi:hypothetical protein